MRTLTILAVALAAAAASGVANATTCYTLLDKSDKVLFQDSLPPVDMSDRGTASREGLRRRNDFLLVSEVDSCPSVAAAEGTTGYRPATVDEIVAGMRTYGIPNGTATAGGVTGSAGPRAAPSAPAASRGSSTATRSY